MSRSRRHSPVLQDLPKFYRRLANRRRRAIERSHERECGDREARSYWKDVYSWWTEKQRAVWETKMERK